MSITDELREWIGTIAWHDDSDSSTHKNILAIADRIDAEHKAALFNVHTDLMDASGWVRLPKDADGEVIHVRDKLDGYGKTITVVEMRYGRSGWVLISEYGNAYADCFAFTHHHEPTVEDVLREFAERYLDYEGVPSAGRRGIGDALMDEYAQRLRLREVDE